MAEKRTWRTWRGGPRRAELVVVIGLGRFGSALSSTLVALGHEVLAIDRNELLVERHRDVVTEAVVADSTDQIALRQLGVPEARHVVVSIGVDIEASVLTTAALVDLGVSDIWAKALNASHAKILERVGARHVITPEIVMGERVAHLITGHAQEYLALDEDFILVETFAPEALVGKTLTEAKVRSTYDITIVCIKHRGGAFTHAEATTVVQEGDLLVVAGSTARAEAFAELSAVEPDEPRGAEPED